jgi:putative membrane protein
MRKVPGNLLPLLVCGMTLLAAPASAYADSPRHFLEDALRADNSEIMLGRMAAQRARDPQVREFGRTLARDHRHARDEVILVGRRFGLWANRAVTNEARDFRDRLNHARGREFDREFVRYMVDDHRKDIDRFREEAREQRGPVGRLAERQLPSLQNHLDIALRLDRFDDRRAERSNDWRDRDGRGRDWRER